MAEEFVSLNVGGHIYTTARSTLVRYPDSMLGSMFSGRMPTTIDSEGRFLIDGDGPLFRYVLNFLRRSELILPENFPELDMLIAEADYYQISELVDALKNIRDEKIAKQEEINRKPEALKVQEFLEVEVYTSTISSSHEWTIVAQLDILKKIPTVTNSPNYLNRETTSQFESLPTMFRLSTSIFSDDRLKLFREITQVGFELQAVSSNGSNKGSTDRWLFSRLANKA